MNKFVMDDKGALLLCVWGLPPETHIDDPRRATASAMKLAKALEALGISAHIGVTTGKVCSCQLLFVYSVIYRRN